MNQIDINEVKTIPKSVQDGFGICVFGKPETDIIKWIADNGFKTVESKGYTNIMIPPYVKLADIFLAPKQYQYMDGFSPNLNKHLHIGHFSNFVLGKALKELGVCRETVSIYGDTLTGEVGKQDALDTLFIYQHTLGFVPDREYFASEMRLSNDFVYLLKQGEGEYAGTKVFRAGAEAVVGIKSDGSTTYFYQDICLAMQLNAPTLYLTGMEQQHHFHLLKTMLHIYGLSDDIQHIGLGLVKVNGKKMASRLGNTVMMEDLIQQMLPLFNNDMELVYNVFAGFILKAAPVVDKTLNTDTMANPKNSAGLYISYTMARLRNAGCRYGTSDIGRYNSRHLEFAYLKAQYNLMPNTLFTALVDHCKLINSLYATHKISDSDHNRSMFEGLLADVWLATKHLGMFTIDKV